MADDKPTLTRRRALGGLATIGAAGALGSGTYALFHDTENTGTLSLMAGTIDLSVDWTYFYRNRERDSGTINGEGSMTCEIIDVKPGDPVKYKFCPHVDGNPAYLQVSGKITADLENGKNEPEKNAPNPDSDGGELDDSFDATLKYAEDGGAVSEGDIIAQGSLDEVMDALKAGIVLEEEYGDGSEPCIVLYLELPRSTDNRAQGDSVEFELEFDAVQTRHNDAKDFPPDSGSSSGSGGTTPQ